MGGTEPIKPWPNSVLFVAYGSNIKTHLGSLFSCQLNRAGHTPPPTPLLSVGVCRPGGEWMRPNDPNMADCIFVCSIGLQWLRPISATACCPVNHARFIHLPPPHSPGPSRSAPGVTNAHPALHPLRETNFCNFLSPLNNIPDLFQQSVWSTEAWNTQI